jgi:hypothetical protein
MRRTLGFARQGWRARPIPGLAVGSNSCDDPFDGSSNQHGEDDMAKGQVRGSKEPRKPKKEVKKTIAANPSTKGTPAKS